MKLIKHCAAALLATAAIGGLSLAPAQASPVHYEYEFVGPGPAGILDFYLSSAPTLGNNIAKLTSFDIQYDGLDFNLSNGSLLQLDFIGANLINIVYHDNLPHLSLVLGGIGYVYANSIKDDAGAGILIGGDPPALQGVPEPASVALLLAGLIGAGWLVGRRGKRMAATA